MNAHPVANADRVAKATVPVVTEIAVPDVTVTVDPAVKTMAATTALPVTKT